MLETLREYEQSYCMISGMIRRSAHYHRRYLKLPLAIQTIANTSCNTQKILTIDYSYRLIQVDDCRIQGINCRHTEDDGDILQNHVVISSDHGSISNYLPDVAAISGINRRSAANYSKCCHKCCKCSAICGIHCNYYKQSALSPPQSVAIRLITATELQLIPCFPLMHYDLQLISTALPILSRH